MQDKPVVVRRILDLFCGAGGAAMGLHRAFPEAEIVGVDIDKQPHYPFEFIQDDWKNPLSVLPGLWERNEEEYFIWASPPCQRYSTMTKRWGQSENHLDFIPEVRERLDDINCLYCIENVPGAPLKNAITLCGSMFGLEVRRHRIFECSIPILFVPECNHKAQKKVVGVYGHAGGSSRRDGLNFGGTDEWRKAMGIDWMTGNELAQAIPPAYSEWVGRACLDMINNVDRLRQKELFGEQ
jgi:DNA (cytosine-5)-methyltransferase 1